MILIVIGSAVGSQVTESNAAEQEYFSQLQPLAAASDQLAAAIADMDRGLSNFLLTGKPADRIAYEAAAAAGAAALRVLGDAGADVETALKAWMRDVATPAIATATAGQPAAARAAYDSPPADQRYRVASRVAADLQQAIETRQAEQVSTITRLSDQLLLAVISSWSLLLLGLVLAFVLLGSWVVHPIDSLRVQLRRVAGERDHEAPITPAGPPEITALGRDAEQMRRELVAETDAARAAVEGLAQESPTVSTIRAALDRPSVANTRIADVYGQQHPAEGVLAGDWWDAVELDQRQLAIALFDVSGHGPTAAIIGLRLKTLVMTALAGGGGRQLNLPALAETFVDAPASFATCLIMVLDRDEDRLDWINAGHPTALLLRGDGSVETLNQTGPLLSTLGGKWSWRSTPLHAGDALLAWTDGLTERRPTSSVATGSNGADTAETTTEASLVDLVRRRMSTSTCDARELAEVVISAARQDAPEWSRDDVTLIVAKLGSS